jgi:hypothetical protein
MRFFLTMMVVDMWLGRFDDSKCAEDSSNYAPRGGAQQQGCILDMANFMEKLCRI